MPGNSNAALLRVAECLSIVGGTAFAVMVSTDVAVAEDTWIRVLLGSGMVATWILLLTAEHSSDARVLGRGFEEFRRVILATGKLLGAVAVVLLVTGVPLPRQTLAIAFAIGLGGCLLAHLVNSMYLMYCRNKYPTARTRVLLVGSDAQTRRVAAAVARSPRAGYSIVGLRPLVEHSRAGVLVGAGAALDDDEADQPDIAQIIAKARHLEASVVILTSADKMDDGLLRDLRWGLHPYDIDLMVLPDVADVAQPKLSIERLGGLSLLRVDQPGYSSTSGLGKAVFDRIMASLLLIAVLPVMLAIAVLIKLEDGGPVFYRPTRVGLAGEPFRMWKFRSMHVDADARLAEVRRLSGLADTAFYKWAEDPRITRIGRILRRTSLDELPQIINVVLGQMSLIGPRPMVQGEGEEFPGFVQRRLSVKPGMTGLWQISGRSDLSEHERVRLDLHYVENWSVDQDLRILFKTAISVVRGHGAY